MKDMLGDFFYEVQPVDDDGLSSVPEPCLPAQ
jgi:hypothetical protein